MGPSLGGWGGCGVGWDGPTPPSSSETLYNLPEPFRWGCGAGLWPQAWLWAGPPSADDSPSHLKELHRELMVSGEGGVTLDSGTCIHTMLFK